jgi:membrane protease YdiL (CAAX protease family)
MSSSDHLPELPEPDPRDYIRPDLPSFGAPSGSPFDQPRTDEESAMDRPLAESWAAPGYPDYDREDRAQAPPENPMAGWGVFGTILWWFVRPGKPHPQFWWACVWMVVFFVVTQIIGAVLGLVLGAAFLFATAGRQGFQKMANDPAGVQQSFEFSQIMWPTFLVVEVISILFGWIALRVIAGRAWHRKVALQLPSVPHFILTLLSLPAFMLIAQVVNLATKDYVPSFGGLESLEAMMGHWPLWIGVLLIGLGPGIGEELFCRGFLGRGLIGNHGVVLGVLLTSILFGIMHVEPQQVIYAPVMGVMLHFIYLTTRSLLMPMLLHTLNNSLSVVEEWAKIKDVLPPWVKFVEDGGLNLYFLPVYAGAAILMLAICTGLYLSRARLMAADGSGPPPWQPPYPGVEAPPPGSNTIVVRPAGQSLVALGLGLLGFLVFVACCFLSYSLK